jgi:DNA-binding winged helix-turn-helix (wHTH) protein
MDISGIRIGYEFGDFRVDAAQRLLRSRVDGEPVPLTPKVFDTLLYLVEHPGELIEKSTLMKVVWPNVVVEENNLTQNISALRRVLGEGASEHRFIVTEPGRGYRFVADVRVVRAPGTEQSGGEQWEQEKPPAAAQSRARQSVQFCRTPDGIRLAYAITGEGPRS